MTTSYKDYEKLAVDNPRRFAFKVMGFICVLTIALSLFSHAMGWFSETAHVVQEQFGPRALLQKYEQFKNISADLDAKNATIQSFVTRQSALSDQYKDVPRVKWAREDREQYNQWEAERAGLVAAFNSEAAEYNAAMSKFNYRFCNVGDLPAGATIPLPSEFKPYKTQ